MTTATTPQLAKGYKAMAYTTATHEITITKPGFERGMTVTMHRNQMGDFYHWANNNGFHVKVEKLQSVNSAFAIDSAKFLFNMNGTDES